MVPALAVALAGRAAAQSYEETARAIISMGERELIESGRFTANRQDCTVRVGRDFTPYLAEIRFARLRPGTLAVGRGRPRLMGQVPLNVKAWCIRVNGDGRTVAVERIRTMNAGGRRKLVLRPRRHLRICSRDGAAAARTVRALKHMFENYCRAPE